MLGGVILDLHYNMDPSHPGIKGEEGLKTHELASGYTASFADISSLEVLIITH